jgi:hypothetical protein
LAIFCNGVVANAFSIMLLSFNRLVAIGVATQPEQVISKVLVRESFGRTHPGLYCSRAPLVQ